ncbi:hypothetical protein JCM17960_33270 [Magnetospira thiophila]
MNESNIGGLPSQQVPPKADARAAHQQPAERPDIDRLQHQQAAERQKPVASEHQKKSGDSTDSGSGVVVDLKSIPRAALPTITGVSPARALSYAVAALKSELSTLFVVLGQTGDTSSGVAQKVGATIEHDISFNQGGGAGVTQAVTQALDGFTVPPIKTSGGFSVAATDSADISIAVQDLQISLGAGGGIGVSYSGIDVVVETSPGAALVNGGQSNFAQDLTGSEVDLAGLTSGIAFASGTDALRGHVARVGSRPEIELELPPAARSKEPLRVATYGPQAIRPGAPPQEQQAGLDLLRRRVDLAISSLMLVKGGSLREGEGEKGLTLVSLDAIRPLFSRREGQVQLSAGLVEFAQAAERATLPKDQVGGSKFDSKA